MQAHEIMIRDVHTVKESDTVRAVIEKFITQHISGLPVVNDHNKIMAYISDGDIMRLIGKHEDIIVDAFFFVYAIKGDNVQFEERVKNVLNLNVMEIGKKKVHTIPWNETVENIAAILGEKKIKKLPVVRDEELVGIISRGDVIRHSFKSLLENGGN